MNEDIELELDCLIEYDSRTKKTKKYILKERYDKLQNNWNELKKHLEKQIIDSKAGSSQQYYFNTIYKYMQELEGNNE